MSIKNTNDSILYSTNFGGERCSCDAHRLHMWLALDSGFGWPGDSWGLIGALISGSGSGD
jgi:hypothetical protein